MSDALRFEVPGEPVAKARPRARVVPIGQAKVARMYTPAKTASYEKHVATLCQFAVNLARWKWTAADRFLVVVRVYRAHEGAGGDLDNYVKATLDGINGIAFPDDRYVRGLWAWLGQDAERPRVEVEVRRMGKDAS